MQLIEGQKYYWQRGRGRIGRGFYLGQVWYEGGQYYGHQFRSLDGLATYFLRVDDENIKYWQLSLHEGGKFGKE